MFGLELWQLVALLGAGVLGIGTLAKSSAAEATAASQAGTVPDQVLLDQVFQAALARETDLSVLSTFSILLRRAGYASYADALDAKSKLLGTQLQAATQTTTLTYEQIHGGS